MSLRWKLVLSYVIMAILPIVILVTALGIAIAQVTEQSPFFKGFAGGSIADLFQNSDYLSQVDSRMDENPEEFLKPETLKILDDALNPFQTSLLAVDANGMLLYATKGLDSTAILNAISKSPGMREIVEEHYGTYHIMVEKKPYTVLERPLSDGKLGKLYLMMDMGPIGQVAGQYFKIVARITFITLALIIILLTFLVSKSLLKSLRQLSAGVRNISEGNLDFVMKTRGRDEVAEVVRAFEQMRLRLKASIDGQLKMEENRRELVANISHDLKTPVTSIKGYVEGLIDGVADTQEKRDRYLKTVLDKTLVLDHMIDDLFLFSKLDLGKLPFHFEMVDARQFWTDLAAETRLDLSERGFDVSFDISVPEALPVRLDRHMIRRVQHNLAENAAKYNNKQEKTLRLSVRTVLNELEIILEDNGNGIPPAELERVFDRFYRADAARNSETGGTGLGLQIARQIIGDHGGSIRIESEINRFTRVIWTLPLGISTAGSPSA